jgi:ATP-dependent DNA ligase
VQPSEIGEVLNHRLNYGIGQLIWLILDGELCGVRPDGTTSFSMIQAASDTGTSDALVFFLFDLLLFGCAELLS